MYCLPTREAYIRDATDGVLEFLLQLHRVGVITYPIDYPDPNGMFYGYDHLKELASNPGVYYATRELVECACRVATALLALKTGSFFGTKRGSVQTYGCEINDAWSPFLTAMFEKGKMQWKYGLSEREEERAELRMLAFENHYLLSYCAYLLSLLQSSNEQAIRFALQRLRTVLYDDEEMVHIVARCA